MQRPDESFVFNSFFGDTGKATDQLVFNLPDGTKRTISLATGDRLSVVSVCCGVPLILAFGQGFNDPHAGYGCAHCGSVYQRKPISRIAGRDDRELVLISDITFLGNRSRGEAKHS